MFFRSLNKLMTQQDKYKSSFHCGKLRVEQISDEGRRLKSHATVLSMSQNENKHSANVTERYDYKGR